MIFFSGLNSVGDIDYTAYSDIYDAVMPIIDEMYERREREDKELEEQSLEIERDEWEREE